MTKRVLPGSRLAVADSLDVHMQEFFAVLASMGYAATTQNGKRWLVRRFVRWARAKGLAVSDLDEVRVGTFQARRGHKPHTMERATLHQFIEHLRVVGFVCPCCASEPPASEVLLGRYIEHLLRDRGLRRRAVEVYAPFARAFVETHGLPERVGSIQASTVRLPLLGKPSANDVVVRAVGAVVSLGDGESVVEASLG